MTIWSILTHTTVSRPASATLELVCALFSISVLGRGEARRKQDKSEGRGDMSKVARRIGTFFLDHAAKQYERSMTRKLNAFGTSIHTPAGYDI